MFPLCFLNIIDGIFNFLNFYLVLLKVLIFLVKFFLHDFEIFFQVTDHHLTLCGNSLLSVLNWFPYFVLLLIWILYMAIDLLLKVGLWNLFLALQPPHYLWSRVLRKWACREVMVGCCLISLWFFVVFWSSVVKSVLFSYVFSFAHYLVCLFCFVWVLLVNCPCLKLCFLLLSRGEVDCSNVHKDLPVSSPGFGLQWKALVYFIMSPVKFRDRALGCWLGKL